MSMASYDDPEGQRLEAERRRAPQYAVVCGDYEIEAGVLQPTREAIDNLDVRRYLPIATPGLVSELARLEPGDEKQVLAFARRWGLLGYEGTALSIPVGTDEPRGDPVVWVWAHAKGIRTALNLYHLLTRGDVYRLEEYLEGLKVSDEALRASGQAEALLAKGDFAGFQKLTPLLFGPRRRDADHTHIQLIHGRGRQIGCYSAAFLVDDASDIAWAVLEDIINRNLEGVYRQLQSRRSGGLVIIYGWDSLVSVAYWHLAEMVAGGRIHECEECGMLFLQKHQRQRFCPPPPGCREGQCALRFRKRKQRARRVSESRT